MRELCELVRLGLLGVPKRLGSSVVVVVAIAGSVAVLIGVFSMASSFAATMGNVRRQDRVLILSKGSRTEGGSSVPRSSVAPILDAAGIKRDPGGKPTASADYITYARLTDARNGLDTYATLRGVGDDILYVRPEIKLVEGRMFNPGSHELLVGRALQRRLLGVTIGSLITLPEGDWTVVGIFESGADSHESEILTGAEALLSAYRKNAFSSVTLLLDDASAFDAFKKTLAEIPTISVDVWRESAYLDAASATINRLLHLIATFIGGIMAFGAALAAINAMLSAVNSRTIEIATLRAIGYDGTLVVVSVLAEAVILAFIGATIGAAIAWYLVNGLSVSTFAQASPAPITYQLKVDIRLVALGILAACSIGLIGGIVPAVRAARSSIAAALKGA